MIQVENSGLSEQRELAQAREDFDASLRQASGAGRSALSRLVVPVACGAAVLGGLVAAVILSRLLRRKVVLLELTVGSEGASSPARPSVVGGAIAAGARALLPRVAEVLANKAAEQLATRLDANAAHDDEPPHSTSPFGRRSRVADA
jgi:hypothetical protein